MTPKNWTLEDKDRTLGGMGVKNRQNLSDIINGRSLSVHQAKPSDFPPELRQIIFPAIL